MMSLVDPRLLSTVEDLELVARGVVEGFKHGLHRSPYLGFSVEFASHREYLPGDDLRHINWKLYGRQDRLYIKQYDAETNLDLHIALDVSGSMQTASPGVSKLRYGIMLAAALAHLSLGQRDAAGMTLFSDRVVHHVKPQSRPDQLFEILYPLTQISEHAASASPQALHEFAELAPRRGMIALISDFYYDIGELSQCIEHLRHTGHNILLFHVLDPIEHHLPLDGPVRFHDLETGEELVSQAHELRANFAEAVTKWQDEMKRCCLNHDADYIPLVTDSPLDRPLTDYLATRADLF
jgi:uncharacterized protein (DUF58 family)